MARNKIECSEQFIDQIKRHEGLRLRTYRCPSGKLTIGWGHNLTDNPVWGLQKGDKISMATAERLLENDIYSTGRQLDERIPWWRELDLPRQGVLLNMAFQMGVAGLAGFAKALSAAEQGNWLRSANEMLDSKWAKQTPGRAAELARQMQEGEWQEGL